MLRHKKILVVIPARKGSKGILGKNLVLVDDQPLVSMTITAAVNSSYVDKIIVSTDCKHIASISRQYGACVPFIRPAAIAGDDATTAAVIHHCVTFLHDNHDLYDVVVTLQPTQPLIQSFHIDEAIALFVERGIDSLVGVSRVEQHPLLMRYMDDETATLQPVLKKQTSSVRRQDMQPVYIVNGMIYINHVVDIFNNRQYSINDNQTAYLISRKYSIDIDTPEDLDLLKLKLKALQNEQPIS